MMLAALLLAAAEPETAIDAERAFAKDAQELGQWTAFRKWASPHGMLLGRSYSPVSVLNDLEDPTVTIIWWPAASFISCDGRTAVNTGPYYSPLDGEFGQFYTVWTKTDEGWRFRMDTGRVLQTPIPAPATPTTKQASCSEVTDHGSGDPPQLPHWDRGFSDDGSLGWQWFPADEGRELTVYLWDGSEFQNVINEILPTP